jgi:hypothetical protein
MKRINIHFAKFWPCFLWLLLLACNASDSVSNYESEDTASGPRIDKEHLKAPPDTTSDTLKKTRDSASLRVPPPGETDTSKLNVQ